MTLLFPTLLTIISATFISCDVLDDLQAAVKAKCSTFAINQMLGSSCYYTTETSTQYTWSVAAQKCAADGGRLATPRTADVIIAFGNGSNGILAQLSNAGVTSVSIGMYAASSYTNKTNWMQNSTTAAELFSLRQPFAAAQSSQINPSATEICGYMILPTQSNPVVQYLIDDTCTATNAFLCQIDAQGFNFNYTKTGYYYPTAPVYKTQIATAYLCGIQCLRWPGCLSFAWGSIQYCALYYEKYTPAQVTASCATWGSTCGYYVRYY